MSQNLDARFDALVTHVVAPTLKPLGYRKKRLTWMRVTDEAVHEVTLQRSHGNASDHLRFYVELSAYVPAFARAIAKPVPDDITKATATYNRRFEEVTDWPAQWINLEEWTDDDLYPALTEALQTIAAHLAPLVTGEAMAAALGDLGPLNLDLFAWHVVDEDAGAIQSQLAAAHAEFGEEERWPRLRAQFDRTAARYGRTLDPA